MRIAHLCTSVLSHMLMPWLSAKILSRLRFKSTCKTRTLNLSWNIEGRTSQKSTRNSMTPYFRKTNIKAALTAAFFLSLPLMQSCKRGDDVVGTDFLPEGDAYASIVEDSFTVRAYSIPEDSLKIDSLSTQI